MPGAKDWIMFILDICANSDNYMADYLNAILRCPCYFLVVELKNILNF